MFVSQVGLQLQPISNKALEAYARCELTGSTKAAISGAVVIGIRQGATRAALEEASRGAADVFIANALVCPLAGVGIDDAIDYYYHH